MFDMVSDIREIKRISINLLELKPVNDLKKVYRFYKSYTECFFDKSGQPLDEFFEFVPCPVCNSSSGNLKVTVDNFTYQECLNCKVVYNNPRLKNSVTEKMYASGEYKTYFDNLVIKSQKLRKEIIDERKFSQINSLFNKQGKILDVGCGSGSFLKVCQEHGWEVVGLDPSESAVRTAHDMYGLNIVRDGFESFNTEMNFDCITFWGLEHLTEPMAGMVKACSLLKPNGVIVFESPSADCLLMQYLCKNNFSPYRYIENARHVLFFSRQSIDYICNSFNLTLEYLESNGLDLQTILLYDFDDKLTSKIMAMQQIIDELLLGDHYRVFLKKST